MKCPVISPPVDISRRATSPLIRAHRSKARHEGRCVLPSVCPPLFCQFTTHGEVVCEDTSDHWWADTTRESGESNEVIGKHIKQFSRKDIHDVESGHVVELIARRRIIPDKGEASRIDVVHFNESEVFE